MMDGTRAITLHQPWATLVALGVKRIETRSWPAPAGAIGERLLIHAARTRPSVVVVGGYSLYRTATTTPNMRDGSRIIGLPLGAVVASATLAACVPMVEMPHMMNDWPAGQWVGVARYPDSGHPLILATRQPENVDKPGPGPGDEWRDIAEQMPYGDFAPGRWAWLLEDVKPTTERCPACCGTGNDPERNYGASCRVCAGVRVCDPIPAKGAQRIWRWTP